jgi:REP element-mobilizing transposase RayT
VAAISLLKQTAQDFTLKQKHILLLYIPGKLAGNFINPAIERQIHNLHRFKYIMNNYRLMKILPANDQETDNSGSAGRLTGSNKGWDNHGHLPHFDQGGIFQAITYRLYDSLPQEYLNALKDELEKCDNKYIEMERRKEIEELLDRGHGSCVLKNKKCSKLIEENWRHFNGVRYKLISYVIMPNHVHILINLYQGFELGKIISSWKGYSAKSINKLLKNAGQATGAPGDVLWQRGYWDRYIRDEKHFYQAIEYIKKNFNNGGILYHTESQ